MCGIIGILRRASARTTPAVDALLALADGAQHLVGRSTASVEELQDAARHVADLNAALSGEVGVAVLMRTPGLGEEISNRLAPVQSFIAAFEAGSDTADVLPDEAINASLLQLKDVVWAVTHDRVRTARAVAELSGPNPTNAMIRAFLSVQEALSAIDRLEVRGRDSAGLHLFVSGFSTDLSASVVARAIATRSSDPLFRSTSARLVGNCVSLTYKTAAEIGELGDNTSAIRTAIRDDELLHGLLADEAAVVTVLGHTRWASVGIISEANAHPLNSELHEVADDGTIVSVGDGPYVVAALNGDVDNHIDLKTAEDLCFAPGITTDAKVIPTLMSTRLSAGFEASEAFRRTAAAFEGSVAIGAMSADQPEQMHLALRGSGQALYIGLAEDTFVIASEPYGVVELTSRYVRMDGETPANPENPTASRGQIVTLDANRAGDISGIVRASYDGTQLPLVLDEIVEGEITTRDIDRAGYPHFLLKEITEAPRSFRKTLRGKLRETDDGLVVDLPESTLPEDVRHRLRSGEIRRVLGIAQGTAHIAASAFVAALRNQVDSDQLVTEVLPATELSGFHLEDDMSKVLVIAVSQSGTTTDTNRTVDLVRDRGATVIAIVNRRGSDLTDKADGVLYTSDGRDVEMSVASTKAFYSQVAAGHLLASAIAAEVTGGLGSAETQRLLAGLRTIPDALEELLERRPVIAAIAERVAPPARYWAMVGNGPNRIAAEEIRIKLSELCYKAIPCDATEDKKHIDLSSEPMILVCAAGLRGSTADDVAKEVAIFRAHKSIPVVIADEGERRFSSEGSDVIAVPSVEPELGFILSTMAGHLFGYEAALAIDALATPLREARAAIEQVIAEAPGTEGAAVLARLRTTFERSAQLYFEDLRAGRLNGHLEANTASRLATLWRYALGVVPLDSYQLDFGKVGTPGVILDDLIAALTAAIDEQTRPVDAIKHQAKTVTVGISRTDESLLQADLVQAVLSAGAPRDSLSYETLRTLSDIDVAIEEVTGWTRYRIEGDPVRDDCTIAVLDRSGVATGIRSRVDTDPALRGTKHRVATTRKADITRGRRDGRMILLVPEVKDTQTVGLTLLHLRLAETISAGAARGVLSGYNNRYSGLRDTVLETEPAFRDEVLAEIPVGDLLVQPILQLADRWRTR